MRPVGAVALAVVLGHDFGLQQSVNHLDRQEFLAEFAVEGFDERVLPRRTGVAEH